MSCHRNRPLFVSVTIKKLLEVNMRKIANALMSIALLISLVQTAIIPVMATDVNEEEYRVLFVGGDGAGNDVTPGSSDDQTMQHLKELGFTVEFSQAAVTKGPDAAGYDL